MPPRRGKNDDKAHPPIHPTAHANNLTGDDKRVYEYITRRYLACCSKDAEGWQTTVEIVCGGEEFSATGMAFLFSSRKVGLMFTRSDCKGEELSQCVCLRQMDRAQPSRVHRRRRI